MTDLQLAKQCPRDLRAALGVLIAQPTVCRIVDSWEDDNLVPIGDFTGDRKVLALIVNDRPGENMDHEQWRDFLCDTIEHWLEAFETDAEEDDSEAYRNANKDAYNALAAGAHHFDMRMHERPR